MLLNGDFKPYSFSSFVQITSLEPGTQLKSDEPTSAKQGNVEELAETCTKLNAQVCIYVK